MSTEEKSVSGDSWILRTYSCPDDHAPAVYAFKDRAAAEAFVRTDRRSNPTDLYELTSPYNEAYDL